jgi:signal transduction histidine kinase
MSFGPALQALRDAAVLAIVATLVIVLGALLGSMLGVAFQHALVASIMTTLVAGAAAFLLVFLRDRADKAERIKHLGRLERLIELLSQATSRDDVASAVERAVRATLPCEQASFIALSQGERKNLEPEAGSLTLRSSLHGKPVASLRVSRDHDSSFSSRDLELLRTIINHATLGLACVDRISLLDHRRRDQAEAWENERAAIIEALAAEIAHEVRYPINFFRSIFGRGHQLHLDAEEVDIGCEEVERLERLVTGLRRVAVRRLERRDVRVMDIVTRAEMLLRDRLDGRSFELSVPSDVRLRCDPDQITQVLVNLMSNALSVTKNGADVGIEWTVRPTGAVLTVWDRGEGFACPPALIFTPWFTTKTTGTGLGLAITHRIARAHGWSVDATREDERTEFAISIPSSDIVSDSGGNLAEEDEDADDSEVEQ